MTKEDIDIALRAFCWNCHEVCLCRNLDGTSDPYACYDFEYNKTRKNPMDKYKCDGKCKRAKKFIQMLKEPRV